MAGGGRPRPARLRLLLPHSPNVHGRPHRVRGSPGKTPPREPHRVEPGLPLPPIWERGLWKPILGEEIAALEIKRAHINPSFNANET